MRGELAESRQRHVHHFRRPCIASTVGSEQTFGNQKILADAKRAERDVSFDNFAGARINDTSAVRPAARGAMHPLDDVIAQIHRIGAFGQQFHVERVFVPGSFKRLIPPARALEKRGADGFRRAPVEVINDGFNGLAHGRAGNFFLKAMAGDVALDDGLAYRRRVVHVLDSEEAAARIVSARLVARRRKLHEGMMFADGDGFRRGRDLAHPRTGVVAGKSERGFDFGVERKILGSPKVDVASRGVQFVRALLFAAKSFRNAVRIAQEEIGGIDEDILAFFGGHGETPQRRFGERIADGAALVRVVGHGAIFKILFDKEDLGPAAFESDDGGFAKLAAVESDVVRTDSGGEAALIKKILVPFIFIDFQPKLALFGVPIKIEIARQLLRAGGFLGDGWRLGRIGTGRGGNREQAQTTERN